MSSKRLLPAKAVCARYGDVCVRTIDRWVITGILPPPSSLTIVGTGTKPNSKSASARA
jgi:hypothetical protein